MSTNLFNKAYQLLNDELSSSLTDVFIVDFQCVHPTNGANNYSIVVCFTLDGNIVGNTAEFCTNYTHLGISSISVENGYCKTNTLAKFPLIEGYVKQLTMQGYYLTIRVSKGKMEV